MYKVSLLPAAYRKYLDGRKKKDMITKAALVVLITLFVIYLALTVALQIQQRKLNKLTAENNEIKIQFSELQQYEELAGRVTAYKNIINSVTPPSPEAQTLLTALGNIETSVISLDSISMEDWFGARNCTLTGSCALISDLEEYINQIKATENVVGVSMQSEPSVTDGKISYDFIIVISVKGAVTTTTTVAATTTTTTEA